MKSLKSYILGSTGAFAKQPRLGKQIRKLFSNYHIVRRFKKPLEKRTCFPFQIFVYHRVLPGASPFAMDAISVDEFQRQIGLLHKFFRVVSLEQAVSEKSRGTVAPNTVCLTFDDGYKDNYDFAFPILNKYHLPATIFLPTDFIGRNRMLWHDRVLTILEKTKIKRITFEKAGLFGIDIMHPRSRAKVAFKLLSWLKKFPPTVRDSRIIEIATICRISERPAQRMMLNWDEVKKMHRNGIHFGAHTKSHPILSFLSNEELKDEIGGSKNVIEGNLQAPVYSFAYPNGGKGDFDASAKDVLKKAEFQCAVSTIYGFNSASQDAYELLRCSPWERNENRFLGRLLFERFMES
ncbi:MAG: polysaccharide deacetylase family protein [Calditrichaeota bacterium]|nr:polysaccharide deacetylase family protein [Calditrichota bacterium]